jgi:uncharacterized protein YndB with AHSA1/START domain
MAATIKEDVVRAFEIVKEEEIAAPMDIVFETILEQMGPLNQTPEQKMPMKLEAWPGGRWYRDLGDNNGHGNDNGHYWGVVQAIKAPALLEISGPLFMSTPAISNVQYRLSEANGVTKLRFVHRAMGWFNDNDLRAEEGWGELIGRIARVATGKKGS